MQFPYKMFVKKVNFAGFYSIIARKEEIYGIFL